jgi:uncharacterized repeat protein (TIGR03803 family)
LFNGELPSPIGGVTIGAGGVLYGTTYNGGASGTGSVFSLTPPSSSGGKWTEAELYAFGSGGPANPMSGVVAGNNGVLYGTSYAGGAQDAGTVFSLTPPASPGGAWTESVIHTFAVNSPSDGGQPWAGLVVGANGELLGTTLSGGYGGQGTVYQLTPPSVAGGAWTETILYSFYSGYGGVDPAIPYSGVVVGQGGVLYGTAYEGGSDGDYGGTLYSLTPPASGSGPWTLFSLHNFGVAGDGRNPYGDLVMDSKGVLYGTTLYGGSSTVCANGCGTVFSVTPPYGTEVILYSFTGGSDGWIPQGKLALGEGGVLYGVTTGGGNEGGGTAYSLTPPTTKDGPYTLQVLYSFNGTTNGDWPSPLTAGKNGALYGTTYAGPSSVFELIP